METSNLPPHPSLLQHKAGWLMRLSRAGAEPTPISPGLIGRPA